MHTEFLKPLISKNPFIFILLLNLVGCISFTESTYDDENFEKFKSSPWANETVCKSDFFEYRLFQYFQKYNELECSMKVKNEEYKFQFTKENVYHSSFIVPLNELRNYRLIPLSFLSWIGLIPNYQERKINISAKVFNKKGLLWEKEYYHYYEVWSSFVFLPVMPIQSYILNKENIPNQTLLAVLEHMVKDFRTREILD